MTSQSSGRTCRHRLGSGHGRGRAVVDLHVVGLYRTGVERRAGDAHRDPREDDGHVELLGRSAHPDLRQNDGPQADLAVGGRLYRDGYQRTQRGRLEVDLVTAESPSRHAGGGDERRLAAEVGGEDALAPAAALIEMV